MNYFFFSIELWFFVIVFLLILRFTEFFFLFSGLRSFPSSSQVYRVFLLVLRFTEFSFSFSGLQSFPSCFQVYRVFLIVFRFTEFSFSFSGWQSFPSCSQDYRVFLLDPNLSLSFLLFPPFLFFILN